MTVVIMEGLDRCGKTTAAELLRCSGFEVVHFSAPPKGINNRDYFAMMIQIAASTSGKDVVFDRSHWGELVWASVFGRSPKLTKEQVLLIDAVLEDIHGKMDVRRFYFHDPDDEALKARLRSYKEDLDDSKVEMAKSLYLCQVVQSAAWMSITFSEIRERLCPLIKTNP